MGIFSEEVTHRQTLVVTMRELRKSGPNGFAAAIVSSSG
jgi:hypothetical protein